MKIKCWTHNRRVMMLRDKGLPVEVIVHRNDGSHCDSYKLVQGSKVLAYRPEELVINLDRKLS